MDEHTSAQGDRWFKFMIVFVTVTLGVETFHFIEHIAQMVQKFFLDFDFPRGFIGQFDLEPIHFGFNTTYLLAMLVVVALWWKRGRGISYTFGYTMAILMVGVTVEAYHVFEHTVRFLQFLKDGVQGQPGVIGKRFDPVVAHFILNSLVYFPILWLFFWEGLHISLASMLPRALAKKWA